MITLLVRKRGIVAAWTGVILLKPNDFNAANVPFESLGSISAKSTFDMIELMKVAQLEDLRKTHEWFSSCDLNGECPHLKHVNCWLIRINRKRLSRSL